MRPADWPVPKTVERRDRVDELTEEQRDLLEPWAQWWIHNVHLRAHPQERDEARDVTDAVQRLYVAAKLTPPPTIEVVPSPMEMAVRTNERLSKPRSTAWSSIYQGGAMWPWGSFLSFMREVAGLDLPGNGWDRYQPWEDLSRLGGFRTVHEDFCVVSDHPDRLVVEWRNGVAVPHCTDGPTHRWRDGFAIYHIDGIRVPRDIVEEPDKITIARIHKESNAEVRRVMRQQFGEGKYLLETGAKILDTDYEGARKGAAPRALVEDHEGNRTLVGTDGSTGRVYYMRTPEGAEQCRKAHELLSGFDESRIINKS